ncbi:MAG TPA: UbiA family prenyltransferase [Pirellulales bacterium]|jgi:4-hydroxybenzoate polyprenyltransferase|nr:UbiA family prenyltransferase [Pirellulales bacterium]
MSLSAANSTSRFRALLELLRLPNVFTALADVAMGFLFTHATAQPAPQLVLLAVASCSLYLAGMVLNDYFDHDVDSQERPERPIPSGRISLAFARNLGWGLLALGLVAGWAAGLTTNHARSGVVATVLALAVVLYDWQLKRTPLGPLAMGSCRTLNVLLGMSAGPESFQAIHLVVALGVGIYIAGVTWFARTEATESHRGQLGLALLVILCGIGLLAWYPQWSTDSVSPVSQPVHALNIGDRWYWFWGLMGVMIGWRALRAIIDPLPIYVQTAVKQSLISLIVLDAAVCLGVRGPFYAAALVALVLPAMFLGRWIYST